MSFVRMPKILSVLTLAGYAASGTIGGAYYDPAYDYSEFFAVTDGRNFQVVMAGAPSSTWPQSRCSARGCRSRRRAFAPVRSAINHRL
ncbi:MAG: hypothetical protein HYX38_16595 [Rhodospirillales bacterium]|nr:hypothetical protein [Rhodospirillales bacterium]